jgi:rhodanese-related sulfurtransferase|uniref:rhodanese-like domain-containing protein n=1 Tax=Candidatus Planktophila sp. TaxID=2175601 RepID=UPI00404B165E
MKKLLAVLAASTFFLTGCGAEATDNLGAQDFQAKTQEAGVVTLDVRTPDEFAGGHLVNALNIDVEGATFDSELSKLDKDATYAVYCRSGRRSSVAIDRMKDAGFTNVVNMNAGILEWQAAGLPLVTQ